MKKLILIAFAAIAVLDVPSVYAETGNVQTLSQGVFSNLASFLYLAAAVGSFNEQINRVVIADKVAVICLVVGAVAYVMNRLNADQI